MLNSLRINNKNKEVLINLDFTTKTTNSRIKINNLTNPLKKKLPNPKMMGSMLLSLKVWETKCKLTNSKTKILNFRTINSRISILISKRMYSILTFSNSKCEWCLLHSYLILWWIFKWILLFNNNNNNHLIISKAAINHCST
jgi:hypothetical protein